MHHTMSHIADFVGVSFCSIYLWVNFNYPDVIEGWLKVVIGFVGLIFVIVRILLTIEKWRGQKIRNKLDQHDHDEKSKR